MFISRFNRFFARHSRILYLGLGIIISLSFVVFVTPGSMSDLMGRGNRGGRTAGSLYGRRISGKEFTRQVRLTDLMQYMRSGQFMSQDSDQAGALVDETLRRMRLLHEAEARGMGAVSQSELEDLIRRYFQRDGAFDRELFQGFQDAVLFRNGYDGADFDEALRQSIIVNRLENDIQAGVHVAPSEARDLFDAANEEFVVSAAVLRGDVEKDGTPSPDEVQAYFAAHRADLRLPDSRRVRVAQFGSDGFKDKATVTAKEIEEFYTRLKETSFKDKTLEQAKAEIELTLQRQKGRALAGEAAQGMVDRLRKAVPGADAKALAEAMSQACAEAGVTVKDSGAFLAEGVIPQIGKYPNLQRQAYALTAEKPLADPPIYDAGSYFVVCWLETIPGAEPAALDDATTKQIHDAILAAEGKAYYTEKVEVHREALKGRATAMELLPWYEEQLAKESGLAADERERRQEAFRTAVLEDVSPYFMPLQKKIRAVVFRPAEFGKAVVISEAQVQAYFEEHPEQFQKEESRARLIQVAVAPDADEAQRTAKRAVLAQALERLRAGEAFGDIAKALSEDPASKDQGGDLGFVTRGQRPPAMDAALFSLEPGQVSDILEIPGALAVVKVEERRAGKSLKDAEPEIRRTLLEQISLDLAIEAADAFTDAFEAELDKADGSAAVAADIFSKVAAAQALEVRESSYFGEGGMIAPFGFEPELARAAFALEAENPCSGSVKGRREVFVACWQETKPGELPTLDGNDSLVERLRGKARRTRAAVAARQRAAAAHATLAEALKAGKAFDEAAKALDGVEFNTTEPFTRNQPPTSIPDARALLKTLSSVAPGTLLDPIEHGQGATIVYLVSRTLPSAERFEEERERFESMASWSKRSAVIQEFYEKLEKGSATVLNDPWKSMLERRDDARPRR